QDAVVPISKAIESLRDEPAVAIPLETWGEYLGRLGSRHQRAPIHRLAPAPEIVHRGVHGAVTCRGRQRQMRHALQVPLRERSPGQDTRPTEIGVRVALRE